MRAFEPQIVASENSSVFLKLVKARHPLLKGRAIPLDLEIGPDYSTLIITGPNTGGKTVALKTIGLYCLMAQSGLPVPADSATTLPVFDGIYADIGDEQSIEQTLSSFSWHMGNISRIIKLATSKSLVLLDELGTSTDPVEGSALAAAIIDHLHKQKTITIAPCFCGKSFATYPGIKNAAEVSLTLFIGSFGCAQLALTATFGCPEFILQAAKQRF